MVADALPPCVARTSVAMTLIMQNRQVLVLLGGISTTCVLLVWRNDIICKCMFLFPLKNLACKGLILGHGWINTFQCVKHILHELVITWKCFPCYWPFVRGIHLSPVDFPHNGPVLQSFDTLFDVSLNKLLNKQVNWWWFQMLWHWCDITVMDLVSVMKPNGLMENCFQNWWQFNININVSFWIPWPVQSFTPGATFTNRDQPDHHRI